MTLIDINDKVRTHVLRAEWSEADAVYLLVEIRKLLERLKNQTPRPYRSLWMHCDWSVHTELSASHAQSIVQELDDYFDKLGFDWNGATATGGGLNPAEYNKFTEILGFKRFREDLNSFLTDHKFSTGLCDDEERWLIFLQAHIGVIADAPLVYSVSKPKRPKNCRKSSKISPKLIEKLVITLGPGNIMKDGNKVLSFPITWEMWSNNQKQLWMPSNLA